MLIEPFNTWQAAYGNASVAVYVAGTTTLADIFFDEALTDAAPNPQSLVSMNSGGVNYGKFGAPLYTASAHYLVVNSVDRTGIVRPPLTTLDDVDASTATAIAEGASATRDIASFFGDEIYALDYGDLDPSLSAATNNATIVSAISAAAAIGNAVVHLPDGNLAFTAFTCSGGVLLMGRGRNGGTVLQSTTADKVITLSGDRAGLARLDLDGVSIQSGSIGLFAKAKNEIILADVQVKRFGTGIKLQGGRRSNWRDLYIDGCDKGARLLGDNDQSGTGNGDQFRNNSWSGGRVTNCTTIGVELAYVDKKVYGNTLRDVGFESNTGIGLSLNGARFVSLPGVWFESNTQNWELKDGTDTTKADENTVSGVLFGPRFEVSGGTGTFTGRCENVCFQRGEFVASAILNFSQMGNNVLSIDCLEDSTVTLTGSDSVRWERARSSESQFGGTAGVTTDATVTPAFLYTPGDGEIGIIEANVVAVQRNGVDNAVYNIKQGFKRAGATLAYQTQTANFTLGDVLTGGTSGATGRITADTDAGATGSLTLKDVTKEFINGEAITSTSGGAAVANGVLSHQNAALLGSITSLITAVETDAAWACIFDVSGQNVRVIVTGAAAKTIEWNVYAQVHSS